MEKRMGPKTTSGTLLCLEFRGKERKTWQRKLSMMAESEGKQRKQKLRETQ
jgi:hypothetical protein